MSERNFKFDILQIHTEQKPYTTTGMFKQRISVLGDVDDLIFDLDEALKNTVKQQVIF